MSSRSGAIRQPADDGSSFDISRQSPEQIAQLFARWKEQRKRLAREAEQEPGQNGSGQNSAAPQVVRFTPAARVPAQPEPEPDPEPVDGRGGAPGVRQYSADFSAILTSRDQSDARRVKRLKLPAAVITAPARPAHGSGMRWTLAIAVSFIALTAAAGAAYWSQQEVASVRPPAAVAVAKPAQPQPAVEQPLETQAAAPLLPAATRLPEAEPWSTALLIDTPSSPPLVEVAQTPLSANHKSIETASSSADRPAPSVPIVQVSAEAPGDFVTSAGGSSVTAEAVHEATPPRRQAANSAERGNQRDRLRLDPGTAATAGSASSSTTDRNGSAMASRTADGQSDPSGNGTAGGSSVGSSADASSSGGGSSSNTGGSAGTDSAGASADGNADGSGASPGASGDTGTSADGTGTSSNGSSDGSSSGSVGGAVDGAVGGVHDAVGGALGGMGKAADGIGKPDGKGKGASAGGKGKGKDKSKDKSKDKDKGGHKGGGKGKG